MSGWEHPRSITTEEIEIANEVAIQIRIAIEKANSERDKELCNRT